MDLPKGFDENRLLAQARENNALAHGMAAPIRPSVTCYSLMANTIPHRMNNCALHPTIQRLAR